MRSFALTLQFYSSKAYHFIRETWHNALPHPSTIRSWYCVIDGKPGFTSEAIKAIKLKVEQKKPQPLFINLTVDEMGIREQILFNKERFYGGVDLGTEFMHTSDSVPTATNALVFMAVSINKGWKVPVGYFLLKGLTARERANLLSSCLELLHDTGVHYYSTTFDEATVNTSMCNVLGANFDYGTKHFKPYMVHPITKRKIYFFH